MELSEIQQLMADLYLKRDIKRGLERTILWFVSEVGELSDLAAKNDNLLTLNHSPDSLLGQELADCLAWLCSIANILNIDLEKSLIAKYPYKCGRCNRNPCNCDI